MYRDIAAILALTSTFGSPSIGQSMRAFVRCQLMREYSDKLLEYFEC